MFLDELHCEIAPDILFDFDPRGVLGPTWHKCTTRLMTWHPIDKDARHMAVVSDVFVRWGRVWDGYDLFQHHNYHDVAHWADAHTVKSVIGARGDDGPYNHIPPRLEEVLDECQWFTPTIWTYTLSATQQPGPASN
ncbi:hypothetical protein [Vibrio phage VP16T]|nr:hypothetical protein [Vibrio phage VP16T]